jgi:hypothetical protein
MLKTEVMSCRPLQRRRRRQRPVCVSGSGRPLRRLGAAPRRTPRAAPLGCSPQLEGGADLLFPGFVTALLACAHKLGGCRLQRSGCFAAELQHPFCDAVPSHLVLSSSVVVPLQFAVIESDCISMPMLWPCYSARTLIIQPARNLWSLQECTLGQRLRHSKYSRGSAITWMTNLAVPTKAPHSDKASPLATAHDLPLESSGSHQNFAHDMLDTVQLGLIPALLALAQA